jgi:hypothetical protein
MLTRFNRPSGLQVTFSITQGEHAVHIDGNNLLTALDTGSAALQAAQHGDSNYEMSVSQKSIIILPPNTGELLNLHAAKGTLIPDFNPKITEYDYTLPCDTDMLTLAYDHRNTATINDMDVNRTYRVEAFPKYGSISIMITNPQQIPTEYTLRLRAPLPKDYIYYNPERFGNRMEVVNNPAALSGKRFKAYQWFENGMPLPYETNGVLYRSEGFTIGNVYSALGFYEESTVWYGDSVYICGQTAVKPVGRMEISPNPAGSHLKVRHPQIGKTDAPIEIYSTSGAKVASYPPQDISVNEADQSATIDISTLHDGMYILKFINDSGKFNKSK